MDEHEGVSWLVELFVEYQAELDQQRKILGDRFWLKEALEPAQEKMQVRAASATMG